MAAGALDARRKGVWRAQSKCAVILSGAGRLLGRRSRRICGCSSGVHAIRRTLEVGGFQVVPVSAQVDPRRICLFDQGDLFVAAPSLELLFAGDGLGDFLIALEPDESIAVVLLCEAVVFPPFVLEDALFQIAGDANVERVAAAGHDVGEIDVLRHGVHVTA